MSSKSRNDKIRNEIFQEHLDVASKGDKIKETHLRWFWHVRNHLKGGKIKVVNF